MDAVGGEVSISGLAARIRTRQRVDETPPFVLDVSIVAAPGITILFGASGAGKSTLLDCIAGLVRPKEGQITLNGEPLFDSANRINVPPQQRRIAYLFQTQALFPHMTVEENVGFGLAKLGNPERRIRVQEILRAFRVEKLVSRKPGEISGGERQRVALARSLVTTPRALLLDEPLTGLDAELRSSIVDDLRVWNAAQKIPILYVTHSRDEVDALGERVIALDHGRVVSEGAPLDVLDAPRKKRLAQAAGFENILAGVVVDVREAGGVMRVRTGTPECEIETPLGYARAGDSVRVAIRAGDILVATEKPHGLSARNILEGTIVSLEQRGAMEVVRVDCGAVVVAHVTSGAVRELELASGRKVWVVIKTHSCHIVD